MIETEKKKKALLDGISFEDYNLLSGRIENIESSLNGILTKVDSVLTKIDDIEQPKTNYMRSSANLRDE